MNKVTIESAIPLSVDQRKELTALLTKKFGKGLEIVEKVNEAVLGGLRVTVGSKRYDVSLVGKLEQIQKQLSK